MKMFFRFLTVSGFLVFAAPAMASQVVDVTVASNGCAAAVKNDGADDYAAIQCQLDYMDTNFGGGIISFPSGSYDVSQTLVINGAERLIGTGQHVSNIQSIGGSDIKVLEFRGGPNTYGGIEDIRITCSQSTEATKPCVHVTHNVPVRFSDFQIWGGQHGLLQEGVDGYMEGGIIAAMGRNGAHLFSRGANWYIRVKFNPYAGQTVTYAYAQNTWAATPNNGVQENHFVNCDFSGNFDFAVAIYDADKNEAITTFEGSVFAAPVVIYAARATLFNGDEFGHQTITSASPIALSGNYSFVPITVTGAGTRACAANLGIMC